MSKLEAVRLALISESTQLRNSASRDLTLVIARRVAPKQSRSAQ